MSGISNYHKSIYTTRSPGYKYRTLATNTVGRTIDEVTQTMKIKTGEKKNRNLQEDDIFDRRFQDLKQMITSKIDKQFETTRKAREMLMEKFNKIDSKVNTLLEFQNTVRHLKKELSVAENTLADLQDRVDKLDVFSESSNSTLLYIIGPGMRDTRDVFQQRGDYTALVCGDYYTNNAI